MPASPLFSIIIPTFNRATFLPKAVDSVLAQSYPQWELIIVDDGSTDETAQTAKTFTADPRIRYHWQENKELNGARNTGIQLAQGQYIAFLDDDDLFLPNHLESLEVFIRQNNSPIAAIRTKMLVQLPEGSYESAFENTDTAHPVQLLWEQPTNLLSFAFHRRIFQQHLFDERFVLGDDFHFLIRVFLDYPLHQIQHCTVVYQQHPSARTATYFEAHRAENKLAAMQVLWEEEGEKLKPLIPLRSKKRWEVNQYLHFARTAFRAKAIKLGWSYFWKAFKKGPLLIPKSLVKSWVMGILSTFKDGTD